MLHKFSGLARWSLVIVIIMVAGLLMLGAARGDSAITDELAHIPAGYSYVRYLDYRLNPEHPPLVKVLASLPLLFKDLKFPTETAEWQNGVNEQWSLGTKFLYENGNDADKIIFWARLGPIILTLILTVLIYVFAKELVGRWWALLPAFLFAFSPAVLAHGHYVTTDLGAAFGVFIALWLYLKYLAKPSSKSLVFAGLAFGAAQLLKFSNGLLAPYFVLLVITVAVAGGRREFWKRLWLGFRNLILIFVIALLIVYATYAVFNFNQPAIKQAADAEFLLATINPRLAAEAVVWMSGVPILKPLGEYFLGLFMVLQRASGGNTAYFLGEVANTGWRHYFPVVFLLKEPMPSLIIMAVGFLLGFGRCLKSIKPLLSKGLSIFRDYLTIHLSEFAMIFFVMIYWVVSIRTPLNIGVRHLIPTLPFIYILAASAFKKWFNSIDTRFSFYTKTALVGLLLVWQLVIVGFSYPYYIAYFNQFGGGLDGGYRYVTDSNYDWGQDLKRLAMQIAKVNNDHDDYNNIDKIAVDYFGAGNPKYYLGDVAEPWWSARNNPLNEGIGWLAVSINTLQGAKGELRPPLKRAPEDEYQWLENPYQPFARAGKSIFIYKLE